MRWLPAWGDVWTRLTYPKTFWVLVICAAALIVLSVLVRIRATLPFDLRATRWLQQHHHPITTRLANALTWLGNSLTLVLLSVGVFVICIRAEQPAAAFFVLLSLLALPINTLLKNTFDRERPGEQVVRVLPGPRWGFSYPSGHAMGSTAFYVFVGFILWLHVPDSTLRHWVTWIFPVLPTFISLSRVYLGAHWLSDVVGGMAGGMLVVVILAAAYPV